MKAQQRTAHQNGLVQAPSGLWLPQQTSSNRHLWTEKVIAGKTLWDWMSLLLVPLLVGIGTILVTAQQTSAQNALSQQLHNSDQHQHASDQSIAQQARYDDLLKTYRDGIDTLLLTNGLRTAPSGSDVRAIASSRTLDVLRQIDDSRKGAVISYLADLELIQGIYLDNIHKWHWKEPIVSLSFADLTGADLSFADLTGADLSFADLKGADLTTADLRGANFHGANFHGANFHGANLFGANLFGANLSNANLTEANLIRANLIRASLHGASLTGADLRGANLYGTRYTTPSQLATAASLSGTIMPDGTKHP